MILEHEGEDESRMRAEADANHSFDPTTSDPKPAFFGFSESLKPLRQAARSGEPCEGPRPWSFRASQGRRKEGWNVAPQE